MSRVENNAKLIEHLWTLVCDTDNLSAEDLAIMQFNIFVDISKSLAVIADLSREIHQDLDDVQRTLAEGTND